MIYTRFGKIKVDFSEFQTEHCYDDTWKYKIDPYIVEQVCQEKADIVIKSHLLTDGSEIPGRNIKEVTTDAYGIYFRFGHVSEEGIYYDTIARRDTKEIFLMYQICPNWNEINILVDIISSGGHLGFEGLGNIMPYCFLKYNMLTFHGVLMEYQGNGIIISAPSGTGKTTHARMWRDFRNALIINGDRATCYEDDGRWIACGLPWSGTSGEQINRKVSLKALIVLERGEINQIHRLQGLHAFGAIFPHIQYPSWNAEMTGKAMELADSFLKKIPVFRFSCRPDLDSVEVLERAIKEL